MCKELSSHKWVFDDRGFYSKLISKDEEFFSELRSGMDSIPVFDIRNLDIRKPWKTYVSKYQLYRIVSYAASIHEYNFR